MHALPHTAGKATHPLVVEAIDELLVMLLGEDLLQLGAQGFALPFLFQHPVDLPTQLQRRPAQVGFKNLTHVHA